MQLNLELWLHDQVTARAVEHPEDCAVSCGAESVSYLELERRSNQMAHVLRSRGVGRDSRVGLCANRSAEAVVGILGILRAGAAYVPLDPGYPSERLRYMLEDSGASVVLTTKQLAGVLVSSVETLALDDPAIWSEAPVTAPEVDIEPGQLAYVIYTSGSTGRPKGVAVTHANLQHSTAARETVYGDAAPRYLLLSSLSFDSSVAGLFWTLSRGGTLHLPADGAHADADAIAALIEHNRITHMLSLPSLYSVVLRAAAPEGLAALRVVIVAGEACPAALLRAHEATLPQAAIFNEYGPTEATVWCTVYQHRAGEQVADPVPIGRPIPRAPVYALDRWMKPAPAGVPGELYIGGDGISRGYIGQPALTAERFVPDPFAANPGARLYRTGDRGRWRRDRQIEFLGRADGQVKLRGFRIELGEVEAAIRDQEGVADAAVAVRGEPGSEQLVAYWVARDAAAEPTALETTIRAALAALMPAYMVPGRWVALNALPTTPNGKLDRNALPAPTDPSVQDDIHQTPIEELVAGIWSDVLVRPSIGRNDNFFALGGHSLSATQVVSRIRAAFAVDITLPLFFEAPTVAGLAEQIEQLQRTTEGLVVPPIVPVPRDRPLPLSFAQQRLWFLDQLHPGNPFYNVSASVRLSGELDIEALAHALQTLVDRHESLRTRFDILNDEPVQIIEPIVSLKIHTADLSRKDPIQREKAMLELIAEQQSQSFSLGKPPLLSAQIIQLGESDHVVSLVLHHIAADGWSTRIAILELNAIYQAFRSGKPLPLRRLPLQYADFAVWQRNYLKGEVLDAHLHYWRNQLKDAPTLLLFPLDHPRPVAPTFEARHEKFVISTDIALGLRRLAQREGVTLFMAVLAAMKVLLSKYSAQTDIVIGTNVANRNHLDTESIIGFFINQLVIRTRLDGDPSFIDVLHRVRATTLGAYTHQDLPFDVLVADLSPDRALARSPLFQVKLSFDKVLEAELSMEMSSEGLLQPTPHLRHDLHLYISDADTTFSGAVAYDAALFEPSTIATFVQRFTNLLALVVEQPSLTMNKMTQKLGLPADSHPPKEEESPHEAAREKFQQIRRRQSSRKLVILESDDPPSGSPGGNHLSQSFVKVERLPGLNSLPIVYLPAIPQVDLIGWARHNRPLIDDALASCGAILFRGFAIREISSFESFAEQLSTGGLLKYEFGSTPRTLISGGIYTSTEYPADRTIPMHNELSYTATWPTKIWFCCLLPSEVGGATPIARSDAVFEGINPTVRETFIKKGIMYVRNYGSGLDLSYDQVFGTSDRFKIGDFCHEMGIDCEWEGERLIQTRQRCQAAIAHPVSGKMLWFNQAHLFHVSSLAPAAEAALLEEFGENHLPRNAYYGDGSQIDRQDLEHIRDVYQKEQISFPWQTGDILMLDNMLVAHGRSPFEGNRKVIVAMAEDYISTHTVSAQS